MSNPFNKIIVIDLEATCWENKEYQQVASEIIEIGACELDIKSGDITNSRSIYVTPTNLSRDKNGDTYQYPIISDYCTNLTGITRSMLLKQGKSFKGAIEELQKYYAVSRTWMSWGRYDMEMLDHQCMVENVNYPFKYGNHINLKNLFGLVRKDTKGIGMKKACELLDITMVGNHHSGKDDAYNTGQIARKILKLMEWLK